MDEPGRDTSFGSGRPLSLGVQEELFLVDPVTGVQVNTGRAALARAPENAGTLKRELSQFLRAPRHVNRPPGVAKVASQLAEDRRHGKRAEADPAVGIEAVDRSQPADRRHLHEVLARLAGAGIAAGQLAGKGQEALEQLIPPLTRVPTQTDATESVISRAPRTAVQAMLAAALTYYGVLAIFPMLVVIVSVVGLFGHSVTQSLIQNLSSVAPGTTKQILTNAIKNIESSQGSAGVAFIVGLGAAMWSASGYVAAFMRASNIVWDVEEGRPFYKTLPVRLVVTLVTVVLLTLSAAAFAFYIANFSSYNKTYGALASVVIFLVWLWITNIVILLGAELNAEIERGRQIEGGHPAEREPYLPPRDEPKTTRR